MHDCSWIDCQWSGTQNRWFLFHCGDVHTDIINYYRFIVYKTERMTHKIVLYLLFRWTAIDHYVAIDSSFSCRMVCYGFRTTLTVLFALDLSVSSYSFCACTWWSCLCYPCREVKTLSKLFNVKETYIFGVHLSYRLIRFKLVRASCLTLSCYSGPRACAGKPS